MSDGISDDGFIAKTYLSWLGAYASLGGRYTYVSGDKSMQIMFKQLYISND